MTVKFPQPGELDTIETASREGRVEFRFLVFGHYALAHAMPVHSAETSSARKILQAKVTVARTAMEWV